MPKLPHMSHACLRLRNLARQEGGSLNAPCPSLPCHDKDPNLCPPPHTHTHAPPPLLGVCPALTSPSRKRSARKKGTCPPASPRFSGGSVRARVWECVCACVGGRPNALRITQRHANALFADWRNKSAHWLAPHVRGCAPLGFQPRASLSIYLVRAVGLPDICDASPRLVTLPPWSPPSSTHKRGCSLSCWATAATTPLRT